MTNRVRLTLVPPLQFKLMVGAADDRFEREADRVARRVVNSIGSSSEISQAGRVDRDLIEDEDMPRSKPIQRAAIGMAGGEVTPDIDGRLSAARASGQPIEPRLRRSMESAFGADFSAVRMHVGPQIDRLNADLSARAFTHRSDVFVRSGDYRPATRAGRELIAHELTHVVQQGGAPQLDPQ